MKKLVLALITTVSMSSFAAETTVKVCNNEAGTESCTVLDSSSGQKQKLPGLLQKLSDFAKKHGIDLCKDGGCAPSSKGAL